MSQRPSAVLRSSPPFEGESRHERSECGERGGTPSQFLTPPRKKIAPLRTSPSLRLSHRPFPQRHTSLPLRTPPEVRTPSTCESRLAKFYPVRITRVLGPTCLRMIPSRRPSLFRPPTQAQTQRPKHTSHRRAPSAGAPPAGCLRSADAGFTRSPPQQLSSRTISRG